LKVTNYTLHSYEITVRSPWSREVQRAIGNASASHPEVAELSQIARADLEEALQETQPTDEKGVTAALQSAAQKNPELRQLSTTAQQDLRLKILELIPAGDREGPHLAVITSFGTCSATFPLTVRRPLVSRVLLCWTVIW
jgi:hypothetical protein